MPRPRLRSVPLPARLAVYLAVIAALFLWRGGGDLRRVLSAAAGGAPADTTLAVAGGDLAPDLVARVLTGYRRDYPRLAIRVDGGGTAQALEALLDGRADVALLNRPPSPAEQALFARATGDSAVWYPFALGGIALVAAAAGPDSAAVTPARLRACLEGGACPGGRLWLPDPNGGLAEALARALGLPRGAAESAPGVVFLADEAAVLAATAAAPGTLGAVGALTLPADLAARGLRLAAVRPNAGGPAATPGPEELATGAYPLHHYLYAACRRDGGIQGAKFVTHLTSDRGQRQIESAGWLPARRVLREIRLTRRPPA